jgi:hypothetical protein
MREAIKKVILWSYGRTSWQYDVLCILILSFVFLAPPAWFDGGRDNRIAEDTKITRLILSAENFAPETALDETARLRRVREIVGNQSVNIISWREKNENNQKFFEIEVR